MKRLEAFWLASSNSLHLYYATCYVNIVRFVGTLWVYTSIIASTEPPHNLMSGMLLMPVPYCRWNHDKLFDWMQNEYYWFSYCLTRYFSHGGALIRDLDVFVCNMYSWNISSMYTLIMQLMTTNFSALITWHYLLM